MVAGDLNDKITDGYLKLLKHLSADNKLELISKLAQSIKPEMTKDNLDFSQAFGAWDETEEAEALIEKIRASRMFNRNIDTL